MPVIYVPAYRFAMNAQFPLDLVPGATAAWATRPLSTAYAGAIVEVRESGGNTLDDIGRDGTGLDVTALLAHTGSNNGLIRTLYDQTSNGFDVTQTTDANQPLLVASGVVDTSIGGEPSLNFDGTNDFLSVGGPLTMVSAAESTVLSVFRVDAINTTAAGAFDNDAVWGDSNGFLGTHLHGTTPDVRAYNWDGNEDRTIQTIALSTVYVHVWRHRPGAPGNLDSFLNSSTPTTVATGNTSALGGDFRMGRNYTTAYLDGHLAELLVWNTALSDGNVAALGAMVAEYYGVTWS